MSRPNRPIRRLAAVGLTLLGLAPAMPAAAACTQADLAGTWQFFFTNHVATPAFWLSCTFQVRPNGAFTADRSSCASKGGISRQAFGVIQPAGGPSCTYKGYVNIGSIRFEISHATMRLTKDHLNGVGLIGSSSTTFFSAVKL